ncbi:MAG: serine hydrolase domain-containing protein [Microbacterium sp.]|uniref:serine hydrolase domain-containing protein n=1 Tax=Microbacterium sp. TaxID=51671 RepID=UPI0039E4F528
MPARTTRRRAVAALAAFSLAILSLSACAPDRSVQIAVPSQVEAELGSDTVSELDAAVSNAMSASGASGAIVGVWVPWGGTWVVARGTVSADDETEVTTDMPFRVGDITRAMTCDALYGAAADGEVELNDPVTDYVNGVPDLSDVTLLQLCNGTSGIGSYQSTLTSMWLNTPTRVWNPRELASFGLGQTRRTSPGDAYRDSDAGYVLLGLALMRATSRSAADLLDYYVFDPLDLTNTRLPGGDGQWASGSAVLRGTLSARSGKKYDCANAADVTEVSTSTGFTDSGVVSTIDDLGRYAQALAAGSLASDEDQAKARWASPMPPYSGAPSWLTTTGGAYHAGSLVGQFGSVPGYLTAAFADPSTGLTVAVVLNNSARSARVAAKLSWELAAIASKAPAAKGEEAPQFGLPWTAEQFHTDISKAALCTS